MTMPDVVLRLVEGRIDTGDVDRKCAKPAVPARRVSSVHIRSGASATVADGGRREREKMLEYAVIGNG